MHYIYMPGLIIVQCALVDPQNPSIIKHFEWQRTSEFWTWWRIKLLIYGTILQKCMCSLYIVILFTAKDYNNVDMCTHVRDVPLPDHSTVRRNNTKIMSLTSISSPSLRNIPPACSGALCSAHLRQNKCRHAQQHCWHVHLRYKICLPSWWKW